MVLYPRYGLILSNIQRNWFAKSSDARRAKKVLQFNFEECWTVLIHTSDKRPLHSHCYQVNDSQVTSIKNILLLKGEQYFCIQKKIRLLLQVKIFLLRFFQIVWFESWILNSDRTLMGYQHLLRPPTFPTFIISAYRISANSFHNYFIFMYNT